MEGKPATTVLHLLVDDGAAALGFYVDAFGGLEQLRECLLDGRVLHAEVAVGDYRLRISEQPALPDLEPSAVPAVHDLVCADPATVAARCAAAGAEVTPSDLTVTVRDIAGICWTLTPAPAGR